MEIFFVERTLGPTAWHPQRCWQLAWFLYGCIEREHMLNLQACMDWWLRAGAPAAAEPRGGAR